MRTATVPSRPSSSPIAANTKSVDASGIFWGCRARGRSREAAGAEREQRLHELVALALRRPTTGRSRWSTRVCTWPKNWYEIVAAADEQHEPDEQVADRSVAM